MTSSPPRDSTSKYHHMGGWGFCFEFWGGRNIQLTAAPVAKTSQLSQIYNSIFQDNKLHAPNKIYAEA